MSAEIFYFSGSGNSLFIAKYLNERLENSKITSITTFNNDREVKSEAQIVGIVFPVYFLTVPDYMSEFMKKLKVGKGTYVFALANAGATVGNTLIHARQLLSKNNIDVAATFKVYLPDNSIVFATKKSKHNQMMVACKNDLNEIIKRIKKNESFLVEKAPIYYSKAVGDAVRFYCDHILGFDDFKLNTETCTGCGLCEKICPVQNITLVQDQPQWDHHCTMCFACLHWCPKQAIEFRKQKVTHDFQYTNQDIKVQEMI